MQLELVGWVFIVEKFADGTERREEIDAEVVLKVLIHTLKQALDREAPLKKKLANTRMEYVARKSDRRKKT